MNMAYQPRPVMAPNGHTDSGVKLEAERPLHSLYRSGWSPRGVRREWDRASMETTSTARLLGSWHVRQESEIVEAVAWFAPSGDLRCLVADYANGRRIEMRTSRGNWKLTVGRIPTDGAGRVTASTTDDGQVPGMNENPSNEAP